VHLCVRLSASPFFHLYVPGTNGHILKETRQNDSSPDPHDKDDIFKVMDLKVKVTETFSSGGTPVNGSITIENHLVDHTV